MEGNICKGIKEQAITAPAVSVPQMRPEPQRPQTLWAIPPHGTTLKGTTHVLFRVMATSWILQHKGQVSQIPFTLRIEPTILKKTLTIHSTCVYSPIAACFPSHWLLSRFLFTTAKSDAYFFFKYYFKTAFGWFEMCLCTCVRVNISWQSNSDSILIKKKSSDQEIEFMNEYLCFVSLLEVTKYSRIERSGYQRI